MKKLLIPALAVFFLAGNVNANTVTESIAIVKKKDGDKDSHKKKHKQLKGDQKRLKDEEKTVELQLKNKKLEEKNAKTQRRILKKQIDLTK